MRIAITGKGGVGKTFVAGCLARTFVRRGFRTVGIDADSSPNLALTLGLTPEKARTITPLCDNQDLVRMKTDSGIEGVYRLSFTVDDIIADYSQETPSGVHLLVMGTVRGMGSGCTCPANAVVRSLLRSLLVKEDQTVILDMEAGVEHLGRGTAERMDTMIVVTDATRKALETARTIHGIASAAGMARICLLGNRIADERQQDRVRQFAQEHGLSVLGMIPFDPRIAEAEIAGISPLFVEGSTAVSAVEGLVPLLLGRVS